MPGLPFQKGAVLYSMGPRRFFMGEIRVFREEHIPDVAALELKVFHGRTRAAGPDLEKYFGEIFLRNPWRDEELPSLVYIHQAKVVGFVGVIPRPMLFQGQPIRAAAASQLMVDAEQCRGFAGLELVRRFFAGPQDLSLTDGATEAAHAVWTAAGAQVAQLYSFGWTRLLRPLRHARSILAAHPRIPAGLRTAARWSGPVCALADAALSRLPVRAMGEPRTTFRSRPADSDDLLECIRTIGWREPLKPCYDPPSFRWLMAQASAAHRHGALRMAAVHSPDGRAAGWYAYYAKQGGRSTVLQMGAVGRYFEEVATVLLRDAWMYGSTAVSGQIAPRRLLSFSTLRCTFQYAGNGVLVQSRNPEILASVLQGEAALTRLDGEWWTRFAVGDWN